MKCYKCNAVLSESDFCNKCGTDVIMYKKIIRSSEAYYNQGLAMAQARDLTGAADSLRRSVKLNKNNIKARNLLGLVYFEIGEAAAALSQWIISKKLQPEKNIADSYLNEVQKNASKLETINQTIKKYNQALLYAQQGSYDLAIIQLKKVLNLNANLVKGHQLLSLLYMHSNDYEKALKQLKKAIAIDKSNALTLQYLSEVNEVIGTKEEKIEPKKIEPRKVQERPRYTGEDVIIPPTNYKEGNPGGLTILNVVIGIAIGIATAWFLLLPAKEKALAEQNNQNLENMSTQLSNYGIQVTELEREKESLSAQIESLEQEVNDYKTKPDPSENYEAMLSAIKAYLASDYLTAAEELSKVDASLSDSEVFQSYYKKIQSEASTRAIQSLYNTGYNLYRNYENYTKALENFEKAYNLSPDTAEAGLLYYMGRCYNKIGESEKGNAFLQMVLDQYPDSSYAEYAEQYKVN